MTSKNRKHKYKKIGVIQDDDYYKQKDIILQVNKIKKLILKSKETNAVHSTHTIPNNLDSSI